ncbi:glycosyl transferase family 39 [Richelia sinica FACHB-800]|uniref:Glycosyl transferase family 39 n=1 Tax=Richelia sinica FACHB-800 TaxID=1357546 RepID=A0A975T3D9_9NOST|nr:glycosyltransferase family 39 protein [Richelia sinica]MBD2665288.1 glycosyltransferase family 39 protein [Richelia sinica FACHB-800]QXE21438.1 glycosyl transferase family 39 [Richelia sinica FACHB-800]
MLSKYRFITPIHQIISFLQKFPQCSLLIWILPLLLFSSGETSLMAHDEGLYGWRSREMFESGDWIAPWGQAHHKTPGFYWLLAIFFHLFGVSDSVARLPAFLAGIGCIFIIYEIGKIILNPRLAYLSVAILYVEYLWLQYCRLSTPDMATMLLIFGGILALLKAEIYPQNKHVLAFIAGLSIGLGFLIRSFMIFLPVLALFPYLIWQQRRHRHSTNPMIYLGFLIGLIPTGIWLYFNWLRYGSDSVGQLLGFVIRIGVERHNNTDISFYLWNLPLKSFPWFFLAIIGLVLLIRRPHNRHYFLLVIAPSILFFALTIFSSRFSHYSLWLYPWIAFWAALGLDWLGSMYQNRFTSHTALNQTKKYVWNLPRNLSYALGILGIIFVIAGLVILSLSMVAIRQYAILGLITGLACLLPLAVWISRVNFQQKFLTKNYWIAAWLMTGWFSLAAAGSLGLLGDLNPDLRTFFQRADIAEILRNHQIYAVENEGKDSVLIYFYTPQALKRVNSISQIPGASYTWVYTQPLPDLSRPHRVVGTVRDYQLIQVLP